MLEDKTLVDVVDDLSHDLCKCDGKFRGFVCSSELCIHQRQVLLKHSGSVHEIGAKLHDSDDDSNMP